MTERDIQRWLFNDMRSSHELIVPNYTPRDWHECDVWALTKAGYMTEHEIKLTVADFRADAEKTRRLYGPTWMPSRAVRKVDRLEKSDPRGPRRFWYVVPVGLIEKADVPEWAGLKVVERRVGTITGWVYEVKPAPELHRVKCDPKVVEHARGVLYYRFWAEVERNATLLNKADMAKPIAS